MRDICVDTLMLYSHQYKTKHQDVLHYERDLYKIQPSLLPSVIPTPQSIESEIDKDIDIDPKLPVFGYVGFDIFQIALPILSKVLFKNLSQSSY